MASATVCSKAVVPLLLMYCLLLSLFLLGFYVGSLFCYALLCVLSNFANISMRNRELLVLLLLSSWCRVDVQDLRLSSRCHWFVCSIRW